MGVTWTGLDGYERDLAHWPEETAQAAAVIIQQRALVAFEAIRAAYTRVSGQLQDSLTLTDTTTNPRQPKWTIDNQAPYARKWDTQHQQPLIALAQRERAALREELIADVQARGGTVVA